MAAASPGLDGAASAPRQFGIALEPGRLDTAPDAPATYRRLRDAVMRHGFVVLRDQRFTDAALLAAGRQFGAIEERVIKYSTMGPSAKQQATGWHHHSHCDGALEDWLLYYTPAVPESGGAIELFDAVAWFGLLSEADRAWARQQRVRHDFACVAHAGIPPVADPPWHPMVMQCPAPGGTQEALYLGSHAMALSAGGAIANAPADSPLGRIFALARHPALYHLHEARAHDLLVWDLKAVAHRGHPWHHESLRVIHEVVVQEVQP